MELYKAQFRKSRLDIQREQERATTAAAAKAKAEEQEYLPNLKRDGTYIKKCKYCDIDVIFKKDKTGRLFIADARHFFTPYNEGEEWTRHMCSDNIPRYNNSDDD